MINFPCCRPLVHKKINRDWIPDHEEFWEIGEDTEKFPDTRFFSEALMPTDFPRQMFEHLTKRGSTKHKGPYACGSDRDEVNTVEFWEIGEDTEKFPDTTYFSEAHMLMPTDFLRRMIEHLTKRGSSQDKSKIPEFLLNKHSTESIIKAAFEAVGAENGEWFAERFADGFGDENDDGDGEGYEGNLLDRFVYAEPEPDPEEDLDPNLLVPIYLRLESPAPVDPLLIHVAGIAREDLMAAGDYLTCYNTIHGILHELADGWYFGIIPDIFSADYEVEVGADAEYFTIPQSFGEAVEIVSRIVVYETEEV